MTTPISDDGAERARLRAADAGTADWRRWGPYVAERAWGGVREDYSAGQDAWSSFPFEHAHRRTYRWNEDGLSAWSDEHQHVCVGIALWNGADPILKERYFGLSGPQGNHGEDAKDYWWYVDGTPTHSFHRTRYAYPLGAFPYDDLVRTNAARGRDVGEYELIDTGCFDDDHYAMVTQTWAKASPQDICLEVEVENRSAEQARIHVLPTVWFRNTWSWDVPAPPRPALWAEGTILRGNHERLGDFTVTSDLQDPEDLLFCENETNVRGLFGVDQWAGAPATDHPKDGIADHVLRGVDSVNPERRGTKAAFHHTLVIAPGQRRRVRLRWRTGTEPADLAAGFDAILDAREAESDAYWGSVLADLPDAWAHVARQAMAGLLSSKQYYPYDVRRWLIGDPAQVAPDQGHSSGRNSGWWHVTAKDVILMPDPWEYPWFAAWDLAFQCIALAVVDPGLAKEQLLLLVHEWYMHPSGAIPAYEWDFSDANPPVQAWAALQIFYMDGGTDTVFLERVLHKLLLNFTWWVNREDTEGNNLFEGGFLGMDNIGAFDRSKPIPEGGVYEQSDGTAWMAMFCLDLLRMTLELADGDHTYDDLAVKFLDHFCYISRAVDDLGLWNAADGFYYDQIRHPAGGVTTVRIRSAVGLVPLAAVTHLSPDVLAAMPGLSDRLEWLRDNRPELIRSIRFDREETPSLLSLPDVTQFGQALRAMLDPGEFLSDHGIRSMSARHRDHPAELELAGETLRVDYEPAESRTPLFGGNSNWRGPVWFPLNALLLSALRRHADFFGDALQVEYPTGSGRMSPLDAVADDISARLMSLFLPGPDGRRPCQANLPWQDDVLFNEYFHGDDGLGLGASHQTGWTAIVAALAKGWPK